MRIMISKNKDHCAQIPLRNVSHQSTAMAEQRLPQLSTGTAELNVKYRKTVFAGGMAYIRALVYIFPGKQARGRATIERFGDRALLESTGLSLGHSLEKALFWSTSVAKVWK